MRAMLLLALGGAVLATCTTQQPFIMEGDAKSVRIGYSAGDLDATKPLAATHCAQFGLMARFDGADEANAYYDCVRP
jgi:hypothetical protein